MSALNEKQKRFYAEYLIDLNATQAAIRAGYSARTAHSQGQRLLKHVDVQAAVSQAQLARSERTEITADMVLQRWWELATADPREIVSFRRVCCRYCHGIDHLYQWRAREYNDALEKAGADGNAAEQPDDRGGYGFDATTAPHPECPECHGEGIGEVHAVDTSTLKGKALALYAGVKQTNNGFEFKFRDQDRALENVARHLGMFKNEVDIGGNLVVNVVKRGSD